MEPGSFNSCQIGFQGRSCLLLMDVVHVYMFTLDKSGVDQFVFFFFWRCVLSHDSFTLDVASACGHGAIIIRGFVFVPRGWCFELAGWLGG